MGYFNETGSESSRQAGLTEDLADQSHFSNNVNEYDEYAQDTFDGSGNALNTQDLREQYEEGDRSSKLKDYSDFLDSEEAIESEEDDSDFLDSEEAIESEEDDSDFLDTGEAIESEEDYSDFLDTGEAIESEEDDSDFLDSEEAIESGEGGEMSEISYNAPVFRPSPHHGSDLGNIITDTNRHFDPGQFDQQSGVSVGANVIKAGVNVALMIDGLINRESEENEEEKERLAKLLNGIQEAGERFQRLEERVYMIEQQTTAGSEVLPEEDRNRLSEIVTATKEAVDRTSNVEERTEAVEEELVDLWEDDEQTEKVATSSHSSAADFEEQVAEKSVNSGNSLSSTINYMGEKLGEKQPLVDPSASFSEQLSQAEKALSVINSRLDQLEERLDAIEAKLETGENKELTNDFADSLTQLAKNHGKLNDDGYLEMKTQSGGKILSAPEGNSLFVSTSGDKFFVATKETEDWFPTEDNFDNEFKQKVTAWATQENNFLASNQSESRLNSDSNQLDKKQIEQ